MEFLLLGPLVVRTGGAELRVSAPRQRIVLATLLLNANRVVSVDSIARFVWDGDSPPSAAATIRTYVMRLRHVLGAAGAARITTRAPGYLMELQECETDLGRFTEHRRAAGTLADAGDLRGAVARLEQGLALWRHDPLLDVPSKALHDAEVCYLQELRLQTLGWRMDMELALQRHADMLPELWRLVREHPLREAFVGRLMLALFRSGQQQEALELFLRTRAVLVEQLGAEPGAGLREIHRRILSAEDEPPKPPPGTLHLPEPAEQGPADLVVARTEPAQLPPDLPDFTGRTRELYELGRSLRGTEPAAALATTTVITGRGGIGKTTLALRAAHLDRGRFTDGQLYANLAGTRDRPAEPDDVLARFLTGLGVPETAVPRSGSERIALYRSLMADRRTLVLLDDARNAAQVRPLLPGAGDSRVLVTSRDRLADLEGAHAVGLPDCDETEALDILRAFVGRHRTDAEPEAARRVVELCSGLPLAVRIVGARLRGRPRRSLSGVAQRLADPRRTLDEMQVGDLAIRATLDAAYASLPPRSALGTDLRAAFRAFGVVDMSSFELETAAVLLECSQDEAEDVLDTLVDAHLLREEGQHLYRLDHPLRAYARERAELEERPEHRVAILRRLLGWYLSLLEGSGLTLVGHRVQRSRGPSDDHPSLKRPVDRPRTERNLAAALARAETVGPEHIGGGLVADVRTCLATRFTVPGHGEATLA
ncbi:BTAD domain-containing putative transcriptional regulator [Streptomyces sp. AM 4-1-1]|uniref:AfsR/SARP family transcriptional regulator n=1 Tax=Streptomyces sp. AM 4-1-1 TaxID=3028710 RepID=UPI0023B9B334|nr:BTAD domain-containing putative transcriptional regulator [Streptomyces sp. AM 4-1-1]WEH32262.1 BTAD domain-containing putative transcriptional regulator [Streptomyces sp. AM 4-1-1]